MTTAVVTATADALLGRVTVVVISRDRRADLERSLPHHEAHVILVDNGSADGTVAAVRAVRPDIDVVALPCNRGAPARNVGVARATTPYVAFADDDSWWAPGALRRAVERLDAHPRAAVLAARVLVGKDAVDDPIHAALAAAPFGIAADMPGPSILGFLACGAVVRRSAYLEAGGFDDVVFFYGEEERLALDLTARGWGLAYVPELVVHHHPSPARDPQARIVLAERNRLLNAVLRRPWPVVLRAVARAWHAGPPGRAGLRAALGRTPRALVHRRRLPAHVEAMRSMLDTSSVRPRRKPLLRWR